MRLGGMRGTLWGSSPPSEVLLCVLYGALPGTALVRAAVLGSPRAQYCLTLVERLRGRAGVSLAAHLRDGALSFS
eukprot:12715259-Alexandrium_andersonii.AAC.1